MTSSSSRSANAEAKKKLSLSMRKEKRKNNKSNNSKKSPSNTKKKTSTKKNDSKKKSKKSSSSSSSSTAKKLLAEAKKRKLAEKKALKKRLQQEKLLAKKEALKKKKEEQRQKKLEKQKIKKEREAEMKRKRKAKLEADRARKVEVEKQRKEKERLRKLAEQEKRRLAQEAAKKKREEELALEKEQRQIFKIAEKAVNKGELIFDNGSLMMSAETEMSFSNNVDVGGTSSQQQVQKNNNTIVVEPPIDVEASLLKLSSEHLEKLGIDKKSLAKSRSTAIANKNRPLNERCSVCEDAWKPSHVTKKYSAEVFQQQQQHQKSLDQDGAPTTTTNHHHQTFALSFICSGCARPVHKGCLHHELIRGWNLEQDVEDAIERARRLQNNKQKQQNNPDQEEEETEENLFESLLGLDKNDSATAKTKSSNNTLIKVSIPVHCVVCRSGKMPQEVFSTDNNNASTEDRISPSMDAAAADDEQMIPLSPPELSSSSSFSLEDAAAAMISSQSQQQQPEQRQQQNQSQNSSINNSSVVIVSSSSSPKSTHKYDFAAAAKRQTRAAMELAPIIYRSPTLETKTLIDNFASTLSNYLLRDGFVVIPTRAVYGESRIERFVQAQYRRCLSLLNAFKKAYEIMLNNEGGAPSLEGGFSNFRERGAGRYEMIHREYLENPVTEFVEESVSKDDDGDQEKHRDSAAAENIIFKVLEKSFGNKSFVKNRESSSTNSSSAFCKISSGCFIAESGAAKQNWHTDGPSLALPHHMDLLPYALNIFIPLINVDSSNGTCFLPGSHLDSSITGPESLTATGSSSSPLLRQRQQKYAANFVAPKITAGDVLLFDYRVWHRGLGNSGTATRPVVYATYSPTWFVDSQNFSNSRYKKQLEAVF